MDATINIWDTDTGKVIRTLEGHTKEVFCLAVLLSGRLASSSWDGTIKIWDIDNDFICLRTLDALGD